MSSATGESRSRCAELCRHAAPQPSQREHGDIVRLLGAVDKAADVLANQVDYSLGATGGRLREQPLKTHLAVKAMLRVLRFGDTVGEQQQQFAWRQLLSLDAIGKVVHRSERRSALSTEPDRRTVRAQQEGSVVPGVDVNQLAGSQVQDAGEHG